MRKTYFYRPRRAYSVVKRLTWRGCEVQILDNHAPNFKYEFRIRLRGATTRIMQNHRNVQREHNWLKRCSTLIKPNILYDPTSHRSVPACVYRAKLQVNELLSPFWNEPWKQ